MTEEALLVFLKQTFPRENEKCEWKQFSNLKHAVSSRPGDDIISYISAISNMNGGHLIIGVEDGLRSIAGIEDFASHTKESFPHRISGNCTNLSTEGLMVEEYTTSDTNKTIWIIHIPKHLARKPVFAHKKAWQRQGDSLIEMTKEREEAILNEVIYLNEDWSAGICEGATLDDLDPAAITIARENYKSKFPEHEASLEDWDDITFLNKAKVTIQGKITRTAIILLGKTESEHFLTPALAKIRWILKGKSNEEKDYQIFTCPFLTAVDRVYGKIRNLKYRYMQDGSLFPDEIDKYEPYTIREALNNCIAHQDYTKCGMINVIESEDDYLIFTNLGSFIPGSIAKVIKDNSPEEYYRNRFLANAMLNLKMVDTIGSGIRKMFTFQAKRFFPMPDYDLSHGKVKATIAGKVLDMEFAKVLARNNNTLSLEEIILLDNVQKKKPLLKQEVKFLRERGLIEGKSPNIFISAKVAQATGLKADYTLNKAFEKSYYFDLIEQALKQHESINKKDITKLLHERLSSSYTEKQKNEKISNLIQELRKKGKIKNLGSDREPVWVLIKQ